MPPVPAYVQSQRRISVHSEDEAGEMFLSESMNETGHHHGLSSGVSSSQSSVPTTAMFQSTVRSSGPMNIGRPFSIRSASSSSAVSDSSSSSAASSLGSPFSSLSNGWNEPCSILQSGSNGLCRKMQDDSSDDDCAEDSGDRESRSDKLVVGSAPSANKSCFMAAAAERRTFRHVMDEPYRKRSFSNAAAPLPSSTIAPGGGAPTKRVFVSSFLPSDTDARVSVIARKFLLSNEATPSGSTSPSGNRERNEGVYAAFLAKCYEELPELSAFDAERVRAEMRFRLFVEMNEVKAMLRRFVAAHSQSAPR
eukprot:ANDGO_07640.mRNA.1 hypothetical protein